MPTYCPECGAAHLTEKTCQSIFDAFLVLEFTDAAFGEVHMLTVACFLIQHERYSDEALRWIERQLRANLEEGISADQIRRQANQQVQQAQRTWKVTRSPGAPALPKAAWSITIADVDAGCLDENGLPDAERYCQLIRQWARATHSEMQRYFK